MTSVTESNDKRLYKLPEESIAFLRSSVVIESLERCVEELIRNAIDANSKRISIIFNRLQWACRVADDGIGILSSDLRNIGMRYYTSKTRSGDTFAFRGEALASIADNALVDILTRHKSESETYRLLLKGGKRLRLEQAENAMTSGTTVQVRDLFYKWPVRRKTSTVKTEYIKRMVERIALAHPQTSFKLVEDSIDSENALIDWKPTSSQEARWCQLFGGLLQDTLTVDQRQGGLDVDGFLLKHTALSHRQQFICELTVLVTVSELSDVNSNFIHRCSIHQAVEVLWHEFDFIAISKKMARADNLESPTKRLRLMDAKPSTRPAERFPMFCLNVKVTESSWNELACATGSLPPQLEAAVKAALLSLLESTLNRNGFRRHKSPIIYDDHVSMEETPTPTKFLYSSRSKEDFGLVGKHDCSPFGKDPPIGASTTSGIAKHQLKNATFIAQFDRKYILALTETTQGMAILAIDQHAADERVRYERFLEEVCVFGENSVVLAQPIGFTLESLQVTQLRKFESVFCKWGLYTRIEGSAENNEQVQVWVDQGPRIVQERLCRELWLVKDIIVEHLSTLEVDDSDATHLLGQTTLWTKVSKCPKLLLNLIASKACRGAIMFNDALDDTQCQRLLSQLGETSFPFQCAHKRPTLAVLVEVADFPGLLDIADMTNVDWSKLSRTQRM